MVCWKQIALKGFFLLKYPRMRFIRVRVAWSQRCSEGINKEIPESLLFFLSFVNIITLILLWVLQVSLLCFFCFRLKTKRNPEPDGFPIYLPMTWCIMMISVGQRQLWPMSYQDTWHTMLYYWHLASFGFSREYEGSKSLKVGADQRASVVWLIGPRWCGPHWAVPNLFWSCMS